MTNRFVNSAFAASNTVSLPSGWSAGDLAVVLATRTTNATAITVPAGWTSKRTATDSSTYYGVLGYRVLQAGDTSIGTWTNAGKVGVAIWTGIVAGAEFEADVEANTASLDYTSAGSSNVSLGWSSNTVYPGSTVQAHLLIVENTGHNADDLKDNDDSPLWVNHTSGGDDRFGVADIVIASGGFGSYTLAASSSPFFNARVAIRARTGFPTVSDPDTKSGTVTSNSSSWTLTYPTNIAAGDLLIGLAAIDGGANVNSWGSGWTEGPYVNQGAVRTAFYERIADGSETGTFTVALGASEQGSWLIYRIPAGSWYGSGVAPYAAGSPGDGNGVSSYAASGTSAYPDPPSLNPANWDVENTLWLAAVAVDTSRTVSASDLWTAEGFVATTSLVSGGSNGATLAAARLEHLVPSPEGSGTYVFGHSSTYQQAAQSFLAPGTITSGRIWIYKSGSPTDNLIWEIQSDASNSPSGTVVETLATVAGSSLTSGASEYAWSGSIALTPGTKYWLVLRRSGSVDASNYYGMAGDGATPPYADGNYATYNGSSWTHDTATDLSFDFSPWPIASLDPRYITMSSSDDWVAQTIAIRPAAPSGPATYTGSFAANAAIKKLDISGSIAANAAISRTFTSSFAADAVISPAAATYTGSFAADATIKRLDIPGSFAADATIRRLDIPGSIAANATVKKLDIPGSFAANAAIGKVFPGSLTADAAIGRVFGGTFTADAVIKRLDIPGSIAANAAVQRVFAGTVAADATIKKLDIPGAILSSAVIQSTLAGSFTVDAEISSASVTTYTGSFAADAVILRVFSDTLAADATIQRLDIPGSFAADAVIQKLDIPGTVAADAVIAKLDIPGSFTASAAILRTLTGSLAVNAAIAKTTTGTIAVNAAILRTWWFGDAGAGF